MDSHEVCVVIVASYCFFNVRNHVMVYIFCPIVCTVELCNYGIIVLGPGLSVSCFSLLPLDGVCALFSDTPFWPGLVSRCSSSRTKDHAIAESDRSDRNQYRNQSESCVLRDYSGREFVTVVSEVGLSALRLIFVGISL